MLVYLCGALSSDGSLNAESNLGIQEASDLFGKLEASTWADHCISMCAMVSVYDKTRKLVL